MGKSLCAVATAFLLVTRGANENDLSLNQTEGRFRIVVSELTSDEGTVRIYLHERDTFDEENLKKKEDGACLASASVVVQGGEAVWESEPLPWGEYAFIVHHDKNNDGLVNFGRLLPAEAIGYSNYDQAIASYPDFEKAKVTLNAPLCEVRVEAYMQGRLFRKRLRG